MAKSYYKQSERPVVEGINWGKIGTDLTTKLNEEVKRREDLKVEIDQASNDYLRTVQDTPQGQNVGANQRMSAFADNASTYMLDLDRKLKAGQIRLRDYNSMRANLQQGTTDMFGVAKKFNASFDNDMLRASTVASKLEVRNNAKLQEFSNPSASDIIIDPITGQLSVVKMIEVDDGKGGKMRVPSSDSNDISSIFSLQSKQSQQIDKFDINKFGEDAAKSFDNKYLKSINLGNVGTKDSILENPLFADAKENYIKAALEPTYAGQSILADGSGDYEYSENIEDKGKEGIIVLIPDPNNPNSGVLVPDLTKDQYDEAYSILDEQFMARLGFSETTESQAERDALTKANTLKQLEIEYKTETAKDRADLANLSVDKIEQDIKQGKEKHASDMDAAKTKEEKERIELKYLDEDKSLRNQLTEAQVTKINKPTQWEAKDNKEKKLVSNYVRKIGNVFDGSESQIDAALNYISNANRDITSIERNNNEVVIEMFDVDGKTPIFKRIPIDNKRDFVESMSALVANELNVVDIMDDMGYDDQGTYTDYDASSMVQTAEQVDSSYELQLANIVDDAIDRDLFSISDAEVGSDDENFKTALEKMIGGDGPLRGFGNMVIETAGETGIGFSNQVTLSFPGVEETVTIDTNNYFNSSDTEERNKLRSYLTSIGEANLNGLADVYGFDKDSDITTDLNTSQY